MVQFPLTKQRIGQRLFNARTSAGLTVREAAERIGIDHSTLVRYENGAMLASLEILSALAELYGLTLAALYAQHDDMMELLAMLDQAGPEAAALTPMVEQLLGVLRDRKER